MKKLLLIASCLLSFAGFSENITQKSALNPLLSLYYEIKDALVKDDANMAAQKANEFWKAMKEVEDGKFDSKDQKAFRSAKDKLAFDADRIAGTKDLAQQRTYFSGFSENMIKLAKATHLSDQPVYEMYCPMKKSSWLSSESKVMNPYYGKQMLNCGKVTETIK